MTEMVPCRATSNPQGFYDDIEGCLGMADFDNPDEEGRVRFIMLNERGHLEGEACVPATCLARCDDDGRVSRYRQFLKEYEVMLREWNKRRAQAYEDVALETGMHVTQVMAVLEAWERLKPPRPTLP